MRISFAKPRNEGRPPTLTIVREDGSTTGEASTPFFVAHDLTHYAVEKTLGFRRSFYGLVAQGWDIDSFGEREPGSAKARAVPGEAMLTEIIVGALDLHRRHVFSDTAALLEFVAGECENRGMVTPEVSDDEIVAICDLRDELIGRWSALGPGEVLELEFLAVP